MTKALGVKELSILRLERAGVTRALRVRRKVAHHEGRAAGGRSGLGAL